MEWLARLHDRVSGIVWGPPMLVLLLGTGVFLTLGSGLFQFTHFGAMFRATVGSLFRRREKRKAGISPFQAVSTALAGTMGTGNITGVAAAMLLGGPGAVFWMWVSALFGMMTKYAEVVLAVHYRGTDRNGRHYGGPMLYLSRGLGSRFLANCFCALCVAASFGIGNMTQANAVSSALWASFSVPPLLTGLLAMALVGLIVLGGITRIAAFAEKTVPLMSCIYIVCTVAVIVHNHTAIPQALQDIVQSAFQPMSVLGGCGGFGIARAMQYGFARGVFSNEAGLGSAPIAHAAADADSPVRQGMWGMFEVFADTLVCCTLTALALLVTGVLELPLDGGAMTSAAFSTVFGQAGGAFVAISLAFFALTSSLGWCYYGQAGLDFLTGGSKRAARVYRFLFLAAIPIGATVRLETVWAVSDTLNGLMALPNLVGMLGLSGVVF